MMDPDVKKAIAHATRVTLDALWQVVPRRLSKARERRFLRTVRGADPVTLSDADHAEIKRLVWEYRRQMPAHLVPKLNPDDPLVRAMELT